MKSLLAVSIGPVQEFIAAARRTSDLWCGSEMLSDISRKVAEKVRGFGGNLIFPADPEKGAANIIFAELPGNLNVKEIADKAKETANDCWRTSADDVFKKYSGQIRRNIWDTQIKDALELYCAWVQYDDDNNGYQKARKRVMQLLSARKSLRDFSQNIGGEGLPKSSLDGRRESVLSLNKSQKIPGVKDNEELCALGLTKRIRGMEKKYPPISRIAADPYIRKVKNKNNEEFEIFKEAVATVAPFKIKSDVYQDFPYDGDFLFIDRYSAMTKENEGLTDDNINSLKKALKALYDKFGQPFPYFAIIKADGDGMGKAISDKKTAEEHRKFSRALAEFSNGVGDIVTEYKGVTVYAGGDDVFAFLPLDNALECAREIRESFVKKMNPEKMNPLTLSVGMAIGHFMDPLEDLRRYAEEAERAAKNVQGKDALAIAVHARSGAPFTIKGKWGKNLDEDIMKWARFFEAGRLPNKFPYDLRQLALSFRYRKHDSLESYKEQLVAEIKVLLKRKGSIKDDVLTAVNDACGKISCAEDIISLSEEMLTAQWIAFDIDDGKDEREGDK